MTATPSVKDDGLVLQVGKGGVGNNFLKWIEVHTDIQGAAFGFLANVLTTNERYTVPAVVDADFLTPGAHGLNAASVLTLRMEAEKARVNKVASMNEDAPKLYSALWANMSLESRELIQAHPNYRAGLLARDPTVLVNITRETHLTKVHGPGVQAAAMDKVQRVKVFNKFAQESGVTIAAFKKEFESQLMVLAGLGEQPMTAQQLALTFLTKLDPNRYGDMLNDMENDAAKGVAYPATVQAAYNIASVWKVRVNTAGSAGTAAVFVMCDDAHHRGGVERPGKNEEGRAPGPGRPQRRAERATDGDSAREDAPAGVRGARGEKPTTYVRTCYLCKKEGHVLDNCPHNPFTNGKERVMVVEEEDDEESEYEQAFAFENMTVY